MKQNLGMVTAYAYAVVGGYEGTEAEFEALLGNIATDLAEIENLTVVATTLPAGSQATASYSDGVLTLGIPKGDTGATGQGATVAVGSTSTGNPGTNASVTNSGTSKDAVFNFTIPRGNTGNGIDSIYLTGTSGAVKTYTILYTDGNTTTFDVTDGEVTNATLTAVLADYAKIDGYYESLGSGTADQLASNIYEEDNTPYNFRTSGGSIDIGDRETDMIVGGTVAWNQLAKQFVINGSTISVDGTTCAVTHNGESRQFFGAGVSDGVSYTYKPLAGHKYYWSVNVTNISIANLRFLSFANGFTNTAADIGFTTTGIHRGISNGTGNTTLYFNANMSEASTSTSDTFTFKDMMLIDLTAMFGSTIADYIYSLEQATAGAGAAWFRKLFPKPYYEYNAGELMSVQASSHDMVGFNAFDVANADLQQKNWENIYVVSQNVHTEGYTKVIGGATYCFHQNIETQGRYIRFYDADYNWLESESISIYNNNNYIFTVPANAMYLRLMWYHANGVSVAQVENGDICINLSWDGERDGEYEAYVKHSYPLDSSLTLRGIPKLDSNNNLYYDGDTYESDGTVTRKYGVVDLGTLTWSVSGGGGNYERMFANVSDIKQSEPNNLANILTVKYLTDTANNTYLHNADKTISLHGAALYVYDSAFIGKTGAEFQTAMSGVYLIYELATPTTETADPYTNPQIVNDFGTEEYVDYAVSQGDRDVSIPVGHYTQYMANLKAKLEMSPNSPEGAGDYIVRQTNGENEYVSLASNATIQDIIARLEALEGGGE